MSRYWFDIGLITVLLLLNGLFAGSELALVSLREGQLRTLERAAGRRERALVRLARDPNRYLGTIQLGITLAGYLASATAAVTLAEPLVPALEFLGGAAEASAIAAVTVVLAAVNIIVGELVPKRLAMQHPARWALLVAAPLDRLATLTSPMVWLLSRATDVLVRVLGGKVRGCRRSTLGRGTSGTRRGAARAHSRAARDDRRRAGDPREGVAGDPDPASVGGRTAVRHVSAGRPPTPRGVRALPGSGGSFPGPGRGDRRRSPPGSPPRRTGRARIRCPTDTRPPRQSSGLRGVAAVQGRARTVRPRGGRTRAQQAS